MKGIMEKSGDRNVGNESAKKMDEGNEKEDGR